MFCTIKSYYWQLCLVGGFREGLCKLVLNGKVGFIDKSTKLVIPMKYEEAYNFSDGLASVKLNVKWGFIDAKGKEAIPFQYDGARRGADGSRCGFRGRK